MRWRPTWSRPSRATPPSSHGGPFANIAHGCNSVLATTTALKLADYVVTEAGFGADLGAEKFFDIKCRKAGLKPDAVVLVASIRALKMHGGVGRKDLGAENVAAVEGGMANLSRHVENLRGYGVPVVVAINKFPLDTAAEVAAVEAGCRGAGVDVVPCSHWADGGAGAEGLAEAVVAITQKGEADFQPLYPDTMSLWDKTETIAKRIYRASGITADARVRGLYETYEEEGFGAYPICMAKTQYSFSTDPELKGAPEGHEVAIRELRVSGGAEFMVAICGDVMTMPGLPRKPAAESIRLNDQGQIEGLF